MAVRLPAVPTAQTVPQIDPGIARDPGLSVPRAAFGAAEGAALQDLSDNFADIAELQLVSKEDVIVARQEGAANEEIQQEALRLLNEGDLSDPRTMEQFGQFVTETKGRLLQESGLTRTSAQTNLLLALEDVGARYTGTVAAQSAIARRERVDQAVDQRVKPLISEATRDPGRVGDLMQQAAESIGRFESFDPTRRQAAIQSAHDQIAEAAITSALSIGDVAAAEQMLDVQGLSEVISPDVMLRVRRDINAQRFAQSELQREIMTAEALLGRPLNAGERTQAAYKMLGLSAGSPAKAASPMGQIVQDREMFRRQFGEGSEQVRAFDELVAAENAGEAPSLTDTAGMRKEFTRLSGDFIQVRDAFGKIQGAVDNPSAAGDITLIFSFMKMVDPGSVVRESEFATASNAAGVPERIRAQYNRLLTGERLTPEQRQDFVGQARNLFASQSRAQTSLEGQFRGLAERSGVDPDQVVVDFFVDGGEPEAAATPEPEQPAEPAAAELTSEAITRMSAEELAGLDTTKLNPAQRKALSARLKELGF